MMCTNCGTKNYENERYCENCGAPLQYNSQDAGNERSHKSVFFSIIAGLVIAISCVCLVFFTTDAASSNDDITTATDAITKHTAESTTAISFSNSDVISVKALVNIHTDNGRTDEFTNVRLEIPYCEMFDGYDFSDVSKSGSQHTYYEADGKITISLNYTLDDGSPLSVTLVYGEDDFTTNSLMVAQVQANGCTNGQRICCNASFNNNGELVSNVNI